MVTPGD